MTQKNSFKDVSIANRLLERHEGPHYVIYVCRQGIRWAGRFCTVNGKRSGGYVLKGALAKRYDHESGFIRFIEKRLKPGWNVKALQRAAHRIYVELSTLETLKQHREQVYILAESRNIDVDKIDKIAGEQHRTIDYSKMSIDDCEFWLAELARFPIKTTAESL